MPFEKYLQPKPSTTPVDRTAAFSNAVSFQIPQFMYSGPPTLAAGGGAEVLPHGALAASWLTNSGFSSPPPAARTPPSLLKTPPPLGLPVYSASGFDLLSILARVASRPAPQIALGPVDLTCSFVVVDVRRHDHPIVYCSPSFCRLTGYDEHEVLGRNCRFLQAPPASGPVSRGSPRPFTSETSVTHLRKSLAADKECQTSIVNYRKDGSAFINLVTVIPIPAGPGDPNIVYHVGFQVDLTEQPNVILQKLRDGTYVVSNNISSVSTHPQRKQFAPVPPVTIPSHPMSIDLRKLLDNPAFMRSLPYHSSTVVPPPLPSSSESSSSSSSSASHPLSHLLLAHAPDFVHVVSLKGAFLYVAPAVTRVLGFSPADLVGRSLADLAHPEDVVPLERELKESSSASTGSALASTYESTWGSNIVTPRTVDMLFRARTATGVYVWLECRGRLHVEPGKGRKAIILSGRARQMTHVRWGQLALISRGTHPEFWALASPSAAANWWPTLTFLVVGASAAKMLGWNPSALVGRPVSGLVVGLDSGVNGTTPEAGARPTHTTTLRCHIRHVSGGTVPVEVVLYWPGSDSDLVPSDAPATSHHSSSAASNATALGMERTGEPLPPGITPAPVIMHVRQLDGSMSFPRDKEGSFSPSAYINAGNSPSAGSRSSQQSREDFVHPQAQAQPDYPGYAVFADSSAGYETAPQGFASYDHQAAVPLPFPLPPNAHANVNASVSASLIHAPHVNVFAELEISRASSWQYELQQLRFANMRLADEITALEAAEAGVAPQELGSSVRSVSNSSGEDEAIRGRAEDRGCDPEPVRRERRRKKSAAAVPDHHTPAAGCYPPSAFSSSCAGPDIPLRSRQQQQQQQREQREPSAHRHARNHTRNPSQRPHGHPQPAPPGPGPGAGGGGTGAVHRPPPVEGYSQIQAQGQHRQKTTTQQQQQLSQQQQQQQQQQLYMPAPRPAALQTPSGLAHALMQEYAAPLRQRTPHQLLLQAQQAQPSGSSSSSYVPAPVHLGGLGVGVEGGEWERGLGVSMGVGTGMGMGLGGVDMRQQQWDQGLQARGREWEQVQVQGMAQEWYQRQQQQQQQQQQGMDQYAPNPRGMKRPWGPGMDGSC